MKGKITKLAASIIMICAAVAFMLPTGTQNIQAATHTHSYTKQVSYTAPTCTKDGSRVLQCSVSGCTLKQTQTITKLGHNCSWVTTKQPTCTTAGKSEYKCSRCGYVGNGQTIPTKPHNYVQTSVKDSTCTATGTRYYKCSACSATKTETIAKKAHSCTWVTTKQPTCYAGGKQEYKCSCGYVGNGREIPATGNHKWVQQSLTNPTCTVAGKRVYKCSNSGCTNTKTETIAATGHSMRWVVRTQPTCHSGGKQEYECSSCGYVGNGQEIPMTNNHNWKLTSTTPATCTVAGTKTYACTNSGCTHTKKETIAATGHSCKWITTKEPTCCTGGKQEYKCTVCGYVGNGQDIPFTNNHNWVEDKVVDSTCMAEGKITYKCNNTGCIATKTATIAKKEHTMAWVVIKEPTCDASGAEEYRCYKCGYLGNQRVIPPVSQETSRVRKFKSTYGDLIKKYATSLGIDENILGGVIIIESGASGFTDGRLKIRFENHCFVGKTSDDNKKFFKYNDDKHWTGHYYRKTEDAEWIKCHESQSVEYDVFEFAQTLDETAAYESISMGLGQIMGSNYQKAGYASAKDMFRAFSLSETNQLDGMINFINNTSGMVSALQKGDYETFVSKYNGSGKVDEYTAKLKTEIENYRNA